MCNENAGWLLIDDAGRLFVVEDGVETTLKVLDEGVCEIEVVCFGATLVMKLLRDRPCGCMIRNAAIHTPRPAVKTGA